MSSAKSEADGTIVMSGWAQKQRSPGKHLTGLIAVTAIHGIALWLVMSGLGQKFVKAVVPSSIVEIVIPPEPPPPPPPPKEIPKAQPKLDTPPPPPTYVPPPEVPTPVVTTAPVIDATPTPPPPAPYVPAPPAPPQPVGPRGFGSIMNRNECAAAFQGSYPREARRASQEGSVTLSVRVGADGKVIAAEVADSNPRRVFDRAALQVINSGVCRFQTDTAEYRAVLAISYKLSGETETEK
jgi:protein TonB